MKEEGRLGFDVRDTPMVRGDQSHWENDDVWSDPTPWQKNPWSLEKPSQGGRGRDHWKMKPFRLIIRGNSRELYWSDRVSSALHTSPHGSGFIKVSHGIRWQQIWITDLRMKELDHWPSCQLRKAWEAALIRIFIPYKSYLVSQPKQMKQIAS